MELISYFRLEPVPEVFLLSLGYLCSHAAALSATVALNGHWNIQF
jgi:hypothetical protein